MDVTTCISGEDIVDVFTNIVLMSEANCMDFKIEVGAKLWAEIRHRGYVDYNHIENSNTFYGHKIAPTNKLKSLSARLYT